MHYSDKGKANFKVYKTHYFLLILLFFSFLRSVFFFCDSRIDDFSHSNSMKKAAISMAFQQTLNFYCSAGCNVRDLFILFPLYLCDAFYVSTPVFFRYENIIDIPTVEPGCKKTLSSIQRNLDIREYFRSQKSITPI